MSQVGRLSTGELSTTITAADWLVQMQAHGVLEPEVVAKLKALLADCYAEAASRAEAERRTRRVAAEQRTT